VFLVDAMPPDAAQVLKSINVC